MRDFVLLSVQVPCRPEMSHFFLGSFVMALNNLYSLRFIPGLPEQELCIRLGLKAWPLPRQPFEVHLVC